MNEQIKPGLCARLCALLVVGLLMALPALAQAQTATVLRCRLSDDDVTAGTETTLLIEVVDVADLYGYELHLAYNDAGDILTVDDADAGKAGTNLHLGDFLTPDFVLFNQLDESTDTIDLALTQTSPSPAVDGSGTLAWATVSANALGSVDFSFSDALLTDPDGNTIAAQIQGCSLSVVPEAATPETPTPETPTPETPTPETPTPETPTPETPTPETPTPETPTPETPTPETPTPETPTPETPTPETPTPETPTPETPTPETPTPETPEPSGSVSGTIFDDVNRNGIREPSEPGVSAIVRISLLGTDRQWVVISEADGAYSVTGLPAGRYLVEVQPRTGAAFAFTTSTDVVLSLASGEGVSGVSFGVAFLDQFPFSLFPPRAFLPMIGS